MSEQQISSERDLDAALAGKALFRQQRLWKEASGQSPRWPDVVMVALGLAQIILGTIGVLAQGEPYSFVILVFGAVFVCFSLWRLQETRLDALQKLLRSIESDHLTANWRQTR